MSVGARTSEIISDDYRLTDIEFSILIGKSVFGSGALGEGDITLATFVGLITGFPLVIEALVLTTLIGAGISSILLITRVRRLRDHIPYGPFLIIGAVITLLHGYPIAGWFLRR